MIEATGLLFRMEERYDVRIKFRKRVTVEELVMHQVNGYIFNKATGQNFELPDIRKEIVDQLMR